LQEEREKSERKKEERGREREKDVTKSDRINQIN
jgi:hypothetical protein